MVFCQSDSAVWVVATLKLAIIKFVTSHNEVVAKVMFLQVSVIHSVHRRGGLRRTPPQTRKNPPADPPGRPPHRENPPDQGEPPWQGEHPPGPGRTPPWQGEPPRPGRTPRTRENPPDQGEPPGTRENPPQDQGEPPQDQADPPPRRRLQHTVYERPVRILLECILV